ncbi:SAF domain-containing protein [Glycomyces tenuis]|uniref:SAF domain-containing protein n=1 Tax=Glycomyces tenuis TaxID=58116 RepID=UPI00040489AC|nr:SAF domain-containing protein [Glycomyces tenuis]
MTGLAAVLVLCTAFAAWSITAEPEEASVLRVAEPLAAGQVIGQGDVAAVAVAASEVATLGLVPVARASEVVGQVAAVPLREGTLLSVDMVGSPAVPRAGFVEVTVALADGRWPMSIQAGQSISLMAASPVAETGVWSAPGTVLAVERVESGGALVGLELPESAAAGLVTAEPASLLMVATAVDTAPATATTEERSGD